MRKTKREEKGEELRINSRRNLEIALQRQKTKGENVGVQLLLPDSRLQVPREGAGEVDHD